ncbi:MAG: insulinase family protein [Muribaculaceae bacterium]|nr:insulinase family protein [Muribaculaceae bacterium]
MNQIPVRRLTLPNGLRIVHSQDTSTAMVAVDVLYNVGSRDEKRSLTGMAHLFEHLMFGGSVNVPDFDNVVEAAGGKNNAWTSTDFTNFYISLPAQNAETAFYLESDRMLSLAFAPTSLEVQRGVVIEEFKQTCLDQPYGDTSHHLRRLAYAPEHPYSWPTIGLEPEHIAKVTMDDVKNWFYSHYTPSNAILSVTGNISFERTVELARKWFGDIPARKIEDRNLPAPGFPESDIIETVHGDVPDTIMYIAVPMAAHGEPGYAAADAVTDLLAAGKSARFTRNLIFGEQRGLLTAADASIIGSEHPGLLLLSARLANDNENDIAAARELLLSEARKLTDPAAFAGREFEKMLNNFEASFRFSNLGYLARASNLAMAEYHGTDINATVDDRRKLTPDEVADYADRLFNRTPSVTLIYRPAK